MHLSRGGQQALAVNARGVGLAERHDENVIRRISKEVIEEIVAWCFSVGYNTENSSSQSFEQW